MDIDIDTFIDEFADHFEITINGEDLRGMFEAGHSSSNKRFAVDTSYSSITCATKDLPVCDDDDPVLVNGDLYKIKNIRKDGAVTYIDLKNG